MPEDENGLRSTGSEVLAESEEREACLFREVFGADRGPLCRPRALLGRDTTGYERGSCYPE